MDKFKFQSYNRLVLSRIRNFVEMTDKTEVANQKCLINKA